MGEEEDGFVGVVDVGCGEAGVIFGEMDDDVLAGDVCCGDDGELVPGDFGRESDGLYAAACDGGADCGSEPHAGEADVVDVFGAAEDLGYALLADRGSAYGLEGLGLDVFRHKCS